MEPKIEGKLWSRETMVKGDRHVRLRMLNAKDRCKKDVLG